ncbi:MAG TPA: gliding motility-associated C-terminal domain-containing protein, partial [Chitinophagales bacterium]|nr:gliding motility-associated C-terminal domain-containing protein [Chitinophagales bacterium]
TSQQIIRVNDSISPVFTEIPEDITLVCASEVPAASIENVSVSDNCNGEIEVTVADEISQGECSNQYTIIRTWTATDVCGNSSTSQQTIRVNDSISPVFTEIPEDITLACASEVPAASIENVSVSDNCNGEIEVSVADEISQGECSNQYTIIRTWTATDECGNSSTSQQTIRVNDSISPVFIEIPEDITLACASEVPAASIENVSATDNCSGEVQITVEDFIKPDSCANKYVLKRVWKATDICGNTSTASQNIIVYDSISPIITGVPEDIILSCANDVPVASIGDVDVADNCTSEISISVNDEVSNQTCINKFIITRTWTATDECGNTSSAVQFIHVDDTIAPTFIGNLPSNLNVCSEVPNAPEITAVDNCSDVDVDYTETIDSTSVPGVKTYIRTWTATDQCGNTSTHQQTIVVSPTIHITLNREICEGESVSIGENVYGVSGSYQVAFVSVDGCDSIVTLHLIVHPNKQTEIDAVICQGEQIVVGENVYTESVTNEIIHLQTSFGCDSMITLNLLVLNNETIKINRSICAGEFVEIEGVKYYEAGVYNIPIHNQQCEGIVQLNLTVIQATSATLNRTICEGDVVTVAGHIFSTNGVHHITIPNAAGCDSLITLNLTVNPKSEVEIERVICSGQSIIIGDQQFNTSGNYTVHLLNSNACDSLIKLHLIVIDNNDTIKINRTICDGEEVIFNEQVFNETGVYYIPISNERCGAIVEFNLHVNDVSATSLQETICEGEAVVVGNQTFTSSGTYKVILQNSNGCDSVVILDLTVSTGGTKTQIDTTVCFGETVKIAGQTFTSSGTYQVIYPVEVCRDTLLVNITVNPISQSRIDTSIFDCLGGINIGGEVYIEPGNYQIHILNSLGCDSLVNLNLRVRICDTIPIGQDTTIYDTLPVLTTHEICELSLPPSENVIISSCNDTSHTTLHGTWSINEQNCLVYTAGTLVGNDTLCISACDPQTRQCNTTTVIITITGLPPIAADDCFEQEEENETNEQNKDVIIDVLDNDTDPDQDALFVQSILVQPKYGIASIGNEGGNIIYTPNRNFCGRDTLYYVVCDNDDGCDTAMVCLHIDCECIFPQVITPNNDGLNDNLFFPCLGNVDGAKLLVWHRWGLIVFEDDNYKNDWNGTLKGELLPAGTYWYSIQYIDPETKQEVKEVNYFMIIN